MFGDAFLLTLLLKSGYPFDCAAKLAAIPASEIETIQMGKNGGYAPLFFVFV
jgi:hypothetical protein